MADLDFDGSSALLEYGLGTSETVPSAGSNIVHLVPVPGDPAHYDFTFQHATAADDVTCLIETATNLPNWAPADATLVSRQLTGPLSIETWRIPLPPGETRIFARLKFMRP